MAKRSYPTKKALSFMEGFEEHLLSYALDEFVRTRTYDVKFTDLNFEIVRDSMQENLDRYMKNFRDEKITEMECTDLMMEEILRTVSSFSDSRYSWMYDELGALDYAEQVKKHIA